MKTKEKTKNKQSKKLIMVENAQKFVEQIFGMPEISFEISVHPKGISTTPEMQKHFCAFIKNKISEKFY